LARTDQKAMDVRWLYESLQPVSYYRTLRRGQDDVRAAERRSEPRSTSATQTSCARPGRSTPTRSKRSTSTCAGCRKQASTRPGMAPETLADIPRSAWTARACPSSGPPRRKSNGVDQEAPRRQLARSVPRPDGREHARHADGKVDAQRWLDEVTTALVTGQYVAPGAGKMRSRGYAEAWRAAQVHRLTAAEKVESLLRSYAYLVFGNRPLVAILPSHVQAWVKGLDLTPVDHGRRPRGRRSVFKAAVSDRRGRWGAGR